MVPVFKEVGSLDRKCYDQYQLTEDILMEHAGYEMALEIYRRIPKGSRVVICSGPGNNGADGITLGRILEGDYETYLYLPLGAKSPMAKLQLERYRKIGGRILEWKKGERLISGAVIVDALFGSGLKRELSEELICVVKAMNRVEGFKLACDVPTGLDDRGVPRPIGFKADMTITMGGAKISLYSDFAKDLVGEVKVANLGVAFSKYRGQTDYYLLEESDFTPPIRTRQNSHKRSYGHLGVVVGEKPGAGIISALAGFNFGAGLVTAINLGRAQLPYEIMEGEKLEGFSALAVGMGLGGKMGVIEKELFKVVVEDGTPAVIDADLFHNSIIGELVKAPRVVLTPHPKEFAGMVFHIWGEKLTSREVQENRFQLVERFTREYPQSVLLLKGANRLIGYNGKIYIDPLGDVALAKGGSGDVLAGLIGALLAQGYHPLKATLTGSLALSLAGRYRPNYGLTPMKLIKRLDGLVEKEAK